MTIFVYLEPLGCKSRPIANFFGGSYKQIFLKETFLFADQLYQFIVCWEAVFLLLGENQLIIDSYFEYTAR